MNESLKQTTHNEPPIFTDWSPYEGEELKERLSSFGIIYIEPQLNEDLRKQIREFFSQKGSNMDDLTVSALEISLRFLEGGMMIDNFGSKEYGEDGRHKFLKDNRVSIGDEEITLYDLSKRVSKLSGNVISRIIMLAQLIDDEEIKKTGKELQVKMKKINKEKGYFEPDDLKEVDELAHQIIKHILHTVSPIEQSGRDSF